MQIGASSIPSSQQLLKCDFCSGNHSNGHREDVEQEEQLNYLNNKRIPESFNNNYNQNAR